MDADGLMVLSLGSFLIRAAGHLVIVDLGWGAGSSLLDTVTQGAMKGGIEGGQLLENLSTLGVAPTDIDAVLLSHLHRDHIGWLMSRPAGSSDEIAPTFPRADYFIAEAEFRYWRERRHEGHSPLSALGWDLLDRRVNFVEDGETLLPGLNAMFTPGHTPGHISFVLSSSGQRAVILGDAVHCPLELSEPEVALINDVDPALSALTKARLKVELAEPATLTAGGHFPNQVFGRFVVSLNRPTFVSLD